jgi:hypothetical protein
MVEKEDGLPFPFQNMVDYPKKSSPPRQEVNPNPDFPPFFSKLSQDQGRTGQVVLLHFFLHPSPDNFPKRRPGKVPGIGRPLSGGGL